MDPINTNKSSPSVLETEKIVKSADKTNKTTEEAILEKIQSEYKKNEDNLAIAELTGKGKTLNILG
jgi:UDP-glucose 6-dehydrogenase